MAILIKSLGRYRRKNADKQDHSCDHKSILSEIFPRVIFFGMTKSLGNRAFSDSLLAKFRLKSRHRGAGSWMLDEKMNPLFLFIQHPVPPQAGFASSNAIFTPSIRRFEAKLRYSP